MIDIEPDPARNLVTITYRGVVTAEEAAGAARAQLAIDSMQPGFGLLVDFPPLVSMDPDCAPSIRATMSYANAHGVLAVVRVIPDPQRDIGMQIMSRFHYGPNVQTYTCETMAEALRLLFD
jgi:hypothetical protein